MKRFLVLGFCLAGWLSGVRLHSQSVVASTNPERRGSGDLSVSYQGYYNRVNSSTVANIQGAAVALRHFFPRHGLFSLQLEPVVQGGSFALGENYLNWTGLPWMNRHWDFAAGDFRAATALVESPFPNLALPEVSLRGGRVIARTGSWSASVYGGAETLSQGNRVPYRIKVPQSAVGAEVANNPEDRVQLALRFLRLTSSQTRVAEERLFFPESRKFTKSDSITAQGLVRLTKSLDWYSEAGWSSVRELEAGKQSQFSYVAGPSLHTSHVSIRANYLSQGTGYLPVVGYYLGDRSGANVDGLWTIGPLSLHGNWVQSRNNRERNPAVPDYFSRQRGAGFQLRLPARLFVTGSASKLFFESRSPETGLQRNDNQQMLFMISRPIQRHNLHASVQRIDSRIFDLSQRLEFLELEDNYTWRRFSAGGAARWQRFRSTEERQSLFLRTSGQYQWRHLSVYGYWEHGKDLENETLFATQIASTSVLGVTWQAPGAFSLRMEGFRNQLHSQLNPESIFVLGNRGVLPDSVLSRSDDWSLFLRITRDFSWGEPFSLGGNGLAQPEAPLMGTLAGYVKLNTLAGTFGADDVWVLADTGQAAKTDATGYFQLPELPQGPRLVKLDMDRLPADLDPPAETRFTVEVRPGQMSRVDMEVTPLASVEGAVTTGTGEPAGEGIVLRLLPKDVLTTTDSEGRFGFYNLGEGDYEVQVDEASLPENARVQEGSAPVVVRYGSPLSRLEFRYEVIAPAPKPVRNIFTQEQVQVVPAKPTAKPKAGARRVVSATSAKTASAKPAPQPARPPVRWVVR